MASVLDWSQQKSITEGVNVTGLESANALSGTIPAIFAALSSLSYFRVGSATVQREFDETDVGAGNFAANFNAYVSLNKISGTLPSDILWPKFADFTTNPISGFMPDPMLQVPT